MPRWMSLAFALITVSPVVFSQDQDSGGIVVMPPEAAAKQSDEAWTLEDMQNAQPMPLGVVEATGEQASEATQEAERPSGPPILVPGSPPVHDDVPPLPGEGGELNLNLNNELNNEAFSYLTYGAAPTNPKDGPYGPFQRWTMQGKYQTWPRSIHGKLFFSLGSSNFVCSASVIGRNVIATAGHCVSDGKGAFATNIRFCPGYNQSGPMAGTGCWGVRGGAIPPAFHYSSDTDYDYACLITNPTGDTYNGPIGDRTGWAGYAYNWPTDQTVVQFGYPQGTPFDGRTIQQVASVEWYEVDMTPGGQKSKYIGSDLTGGSSGGGWFLSWRHPSAEYADTDDSWWTDPAGAQKGPFINGVNSHRRCVSNCGTPPTTTAGVFWQEMGSPQFLSSDSDGQDASDVFQICFDNQ